MKTNLIFCKSEQVVNYTYLRRWPTRASALLSVLSEGKLRTFHIPAELASQTRRQVELHKRFQQVAAAICRINLRRLLGHKQQNQAREQG